MSILRDFEKRLEGAVEGFFARAFRSGLQPVELAKAIQRYASNYQQVGIEGVYVPNVYRFTLSPEDAQRFSGFSESLKAELSEVVTRTAADRGWRLRGGLVVQLTESEDVRPGTYELRGKVQQPTAPASAASAPSQPSPAPGPSGGAGATQVLNGARPALETADGRRHPISGSVVLGRLPECDITFDDSAISRRHARVREAEGSGYEVEDLGSTNGVRVNGEKVGRARLHDGDRLDLGGVHLTFHAGG